MMLKVLDLLAEDPNRWWTSPEVAFQFSLTVPHASELLRQYRNRSLVRRRRVRTKYNPPRLYEYCIAVNGHRKLAYLRQRRVVAEYISGDVASADKLAKHLLRDIS